MIEAYLTFSGRMRRFKLFVYSLALIVILVILAIIGMLTIDLARSPRIASLCFQAAMAVLWLLGLAAMSVKRLHDVDKPGWHVLWLLLAPQALIVATSAGEFSLSGGSIAYSLDFGVLGLIGLVWFLVGLLYLALARGSDGPNKYGYPP